MWKILFDFYKERATNIHMCRYKIITNACAKADWLEEQTNPFIYTGDWWFQQNIPGATAVKITCI